MRLLTHLLGVLLLESDALLGDVKHPLRAERGSLDSIKSGQKLVILDDASAEERIVSHVLNGTCRDPVLMRSRALPTQRMQQAAELEPERILATERMESVMVSDNCTFLSFDDDRNWAKESLIRDGLLVPETREMTVGEFFERASQGAGCLFYSGVANHHEALQSRLGVEQLAAVTDVRIFNNEPPRARLELLSKAAVSGAKYDDRHRLITQLIGRTKIRLWPPRAHLSMCAQSRALPRGEGRGCVCVCVRGLRG